MGVVVVGVDGSPHSVAALRAAADEARCRSARLQVVYVYEPVRGLDTSMAAVVAAGHFASTDESSGVLRRAQQRTDEERSEAQRHADGLIRQIVDEADADLSGLDVGCTATSDERPAASLIELSREADLLVVGSRGLGGFRGLLLGSVSQQCVHHAPCDVMVVRSDHSDAARG